MKVKFGTGRRCINPELPISLAGYFNRRPWNEVLDDLEVRAVVFREGGDYSAIIQFDVLSINYFLYTEVFDAVKAAGIKDFSSKNLRDAKIVVRPGNPELCDLKFKLDRRGVVQWQILAGRHRNEQVAFVVDGKLLARFIPETSEDENEVWVFLRVGIDHFHARNIVKYAKKNYVYYNPDSSNFFKFF